VIFRSQDVQPSDKSPRAVPCGRRAVMSDSNSPDTPQFELSQFEQLARKRRATRHFSPQPVERELVERLLRTAQWAPSGYNLQPTRFVVVSDPANRLRITRACMNQQAVGEAPIVVVFAGDRRAADRLEETLGSDLAAGAITPDHANFLRRIVRLMFRQGPLGIGWFWKATLIPVARVFVPIPQFMAVHKRFWLAKQVMLCAMNFMLAAEAAGLGTVPMEGFDSGRLRRTLDLPPSWEPILVVPVGYANAGPAKKSRLALGRVTIWR
jgi:nitroreductase